MDQGRLEQIVKEREARKAEWLQIYDYIVIVAGSRSFRDYALFERIIEAWIKRNQHVVNGLFTFLSGGAKDGPDEMILRFCDRDRETYTCQRLPALWDHYKQEGRKNPAGVIRNHEMGDIATHLVAIWDGQSSGTKDMIDYAVKKGLHVDVSLVNPTHPRRAA